MPAEWERHSAIWLSWPYDETTFPGRVPLAEESYLSMIHAIHQSEDVHLLVLNEGVGKSVQQRLRAKQVDLSKVHFHVTTYADVWFRDYGPTFVINEVEHTLAMVHWTFNAWGSKYKELMEDTRIPRVMNEWMKLTRFEPGIVMEGGSIDVNGAGTVLTTEQCLLNPNRNPHLDRTSLEVNLREYLGVRHVVWLGEGIVGDDTDGHIDDIARFVNPTTIVCAYEEDPQDENFKLLEDNYQRLRFAKDQDGHPFSIVQLPMPGRVGDAEGRLPASYANFYIGNTVILLPTFNHANDKKAVTILQGLFPEREVVGIPAQDLVYGLGTLHCMSQQQPAV